MNANATAFGGPGRIAEPASAGAGSNIYAAASEMCAVHWQGFDNIGGCVDSYL